MKQKIISAIVAGLLIITTAVPVFATPNQEVLDKQAEYEKFEKDIEKKQGEIFKLNGKIEPLVEKVENNNKESDNIKAEIENTKKEIEASKVQMEDKEEMLGKRLRELYKSGGQSSYLAVIFQADSFSDLITRLDSTTRLVNIDKKVVTGLIEEQDKLNEKVASLEEKSADIQKINAETEKSLKELETQKAEQEKLVNEVKAEQAKFDEQYLATAERGLVSYEFSVIDDSSSSKSNLQSAISRLENIRDTQIKSPTVIAEINQYIDQAQGKINEIIAQENTVTPDPPNRGDGSSATGNAIVDYAYQFLGVPYVWGGTTPAGFDCSGFTSYVYLNAAGINITRTTYSQINQGVPVAYGDMQPGDLVFTYNADHVGIYVGGGSYIHAPQPGDVVKVSPVHGFYAARRVL